MKQQVNKTFQEISKVIGVEKPGRIAAMDAITFPGDVYVYGVWSGMSTKFISDYLHDKQIQYGKMFGFDSFMGLPDEKEYVRHQEHTPGKYSSAALYGDTLVNTTTRIQEGIGNDRLTLIPGFFEDVLDKELVHMKSMRAASFIDMDVDLCSSAITVLVFMCENSLIKKDTIIYFDDWGATPEYKGGVSLAWKLMSAKYSIKYEEIFSYAKKRHRSQVLKVFVIK